MMPLGKTVSGTNLADFAVIQFNIITNTLHVQYRGLLIGNFLNKLAEAPYYFG